MSNWQGSNKRICSVHMQLLALLGTLSGSILTMLLFAVIRLS
jgi:hypothetical protein